MAPANSVIVLHKKYAKAFKLFKAAELSDIYKALEEWQHYYMSTSWEMFGQHLERVQNYLNKSKLDIDKKRAITHSLGLQRGVYLTGIEWPERRLYINEQDRRDLTDCRTYLLKKFSFSNDIYTLSSDEVKKLSVQEQGAIETIKEVNCRIELLDLKLRESAHSLNSASADAKRLTALEEKALLRANAGNKSVTKATRANSDAGKKVAEKSLADLCIPGRKLQENSPKYKDAQVDIAKKIKFVWDSLPSEISFSRGTKTYEGDMRASAVAVFKLMQWIGKVEKGGPAKWIDILGYEWGLKLSSGISRYNIGETSPIHFVEVVKSAFAIINDKFPLWLKNVKELPERYR